MEGEGCNAVSPQACVGEKTTENKRTYLVHLLLPPPRPAPPFPLADTEKDNGQCEVCLFFTSSLSLFSALRHRITSACVWAGACSCRWPHNTGATAATGTVVMLSVHFSLPRCRGSRPFPAIYIWGCALAQSGSFLSVLGSTSG